MSEEYSPSVADEVNPGPTLEEQAVELGIPMEGIPGDPAPVAATDNMILGKFQDQSQLEQAYTNLEQRMGQGADMSAPLTQASEYFTQNGTLTEEHYSALEQSGLNRDIVNSYITGIQAQQQQQTYDHYATVGGQENYTQMSDWMINYLPATEVDAYNRVMEGGTDAEINVLMSGMYSRYQTAYSQNYTQVQGEAQPEQPAGFQSRGQVMEALNDARYETDQAYRDEVENMLAVTPDEIF
jgi:hypothetical protein